MWKRRAATEASDRRGFERWLIDKSFSMLAPMCRIGVMVTIALLAVVDPLLYHSGLWGSAPEHGQLVVWHACALLYFLVHLFASRYGTSHRRRKAVLLGFFVISAALFTWFAFTSWKLGGDLTTYAIFLLSMVCVFGYPGKARACINLVATGTLVGSIVAVGGGASFVTSGAAVNLLCLAMVAVLISRYLMQLNLSLYEEKHLVELERARADRVLYNALPESIADELKNHNMVKAEKYQRMAVLFADIVGFTEFSAQRSPDAVLRVLNEIFSEFDTLVDQHGVEKIKTIGDAYMAVGKDQVASIAALALRMQQTIARYSLQHGYALDIRCGIHVGPVVAGVIGLKRFLYDVWGDAVNTASRMESTGECGRIQVSEEVFLALKDRFRFAPRGRVEIKGKGAMVTYFLLEALPPGEDGGASAHQPGSLGQVVHQELHLVRQDAAVAQDEVLPEAGNVGRI
jgi:class 3 adenylate cyclase